MILVTAFGSLRWGEVAALRRRDLDLDRGTVTVARAFVEIGGRAPVSSPPKSRAGLRTLALPREVVERLRHHLAEFTGPGAEDRVFVGPKGADLRRANFNKLVRWEQSVAVIGAPGLHFHDLRHTGNMLAASVPGVSTKDLMQRMGHDSMRAALIYQHASAEADMRVSEGLSVRIREMSAPTPIAGGSHEYIADDPVEDPETHRAPGKRGL